MLWLISNCQYFEFKTIIKTQIAKIIIRKGVPHLDKMSDFKAASVEKCSCQKHKMMAHLTPCIISYLIYGKFTAETFMEIIFNTQNQSTEGHHVEMLAYV